MGISPHTHIKIIESNKSFILSLFLCGKKAKFVAQGIYCLDQDRITQLFSYLSSIFFSFLLCSFSFSFLFFVCVVIDEDMFWPLTRAQNLYEEDTPLNYWVNLWGLSALFYKDCPKK